MGHLLDFGLLLAWWQKKKKKKKKDCLFMFFQLRWPSRLTETPLCLLEQEYTKPILGGGHGNPRQNLAWRIPRTKESCRLQSIGSHRVRHYWSDLAHRYAYKSNIKCYGHWANKSQSWSGLRACLCCCLCTCSDVSFVTSWTVACQALRFMEIPRQEY